MKIPTITRFAEKLLLACLAIILLYLIGTAVYANCSTAALKHITVFDMLHNAFLSVVISLGGGILLDCEVRSRENRR